LSRNAGAPEQLALADDYWSLLKEESNAVAHLEAARRLEPESEDVQTRYRELGYQWNGSRWSKPSDREPSAAPIPGVRKDLAIGLTSTEVRQIQGAPARIGTVISGQGADEYWMYGDPRGSRLVIQFHRPLHQTELRVVRIDQR